MADRGEVEAFPGWVERVRAISRRRLDRGLGSDWVVAVSGGSDSVGLLRALHAIGPDLGLSLSVAHLDHGARGEAAEADARFVAGLAADLALPFDLGHWRPERAGHFEADARRARYAWLAEVARDRGAAAVAVGQTRDDQAETILHRIVRGTGPRGLAGMPSTRPLDGSMMLIRPILTASRAEVRAWLETLGQAWRDDASNRDTTRTRARIRLELLPRLAADFNPDVVGALLRLGRLAGEASRIVDRRAAEVLRAATRAASPDAIGLDRAILARLRRAERAEVFRLAWRRQGWPEAAMTADRWDRLADWARSGRGRASIGDGVEVEVRDGLIRLLRDGGTQEPPSPPVALAIPGVADWGGGRLVASLGPDGPADEAIDHDRIVPPLTVGPPRPGDRFDPLGLGGRTRALNDLFRSRQVARADRPSTPIVRDASGIVWVVGHRIAHRVRRTEATERVVGFRWEATDAAVRSPS